MISKADTTSVAGNAVLYECIRTTLSLTVSSAHLIEAAGILSKFLQNSNPDIRYVSLPPVASTCEEHSDEQMTSIDEMQWLVTEHSSWVVCEKRTLRSDVAHWSF